MKQNLFIGLCLLLVLSACGKGDDSAPSNAQVVTQNAVVPGATSVDFPIEQRNGMFRVSYFFYENGCHTGRHRVAGYDYERTRQRLCLRLQDDWRHKGCARNLRMSYFQSMCSGITWNPN